MCSYSVSVFQAEAPGSLRQCSARFKEGACVRFPYMATIYSNPVLSSAVRVISRKFFVSVFGLE